MSRSLTKAQRLQDMERRYYLRAYSDEELSEIYQVERTTIFRDRQEMETEGEVPFVEEDRGRYRINREKYLSNIRLSRDEALALYLPSRRSARQTFIAQPHTASALEKLALALKQPMTERLVKSANDILRHVTQPERVAIMETVTRAWVEQIPLHIAYQGLHGTKPFNYTVHPYLLEPSLWSDGTYIIGHSEVHDEIKVFKIERIVRASLGTGTFTISQDFDEQRILKFAWGIWLGDEEPQTVKLRFAPGNATTRIKESIWHPQQKDPVDLSDGGCIWEAQVAEPREMISWIRGWGADCEVLEPNWLREMLIDEARRLSRLYGVAQPTQSPEVTRLLRCWGKTAFGSQNAAEFHPAFFHMLDVAQVARALLGVSGSPRWRAVLGKMFDADPDTLADWLPWLIAMHDIGKLSAPFQSQNALQMARLVTEGFEFGLKQWNNTPYHTLVGQVFLAHEFDEAADLPEKLSTAWRDMLGGHHGIFISASQLNEARRVLRNEPPEWKVLRINAAQLLKNQLAIHLPHPLPEPENVSTASMALTGFTILCDWLGSDSKHFQLRPETPLADYVEESARKAQQAVAGLWQEHFSITPPTFSALFPARTPRPLQSAIDDISAEVLARPCLAMMEAPTGEGKTEAALALAHRLAKASGSDELYYALPTTATSNQMFRRVQTYLHDNLRLTTRVKLVHGQAFLVEDDLRPEFLDNGDGRENSAALEWFGPKKRAMLAPFGVGTIDQAELAALNVRHTALRLMGLAGKVVIVDEVHAYDTYMTTIIERLLHWLGQMGTSVILLSATLPKARRAALARAYGAALKEQSDDDAYPSLWVINEQTHYRSYPAAQQPDRALQLKHLNYADDETGLQARAEWLLEAIKDGGCVCWVTNTVDRAQKLFALVDAQTAPDVQRALLHARFPLDERQDGEAELVRLYGPGEADRPHKGIVIGTQVLEQSLDLDFDVLASDLAPVDLLLQRAGRMHRHARQRPRAHAVPRLYVNAPNVADERSLGVDALIYEEFVLRQTWMVLHERDQINLPNDYRVLIESVYGITNTPTDPTLAKAWDKLQNTESYAGEQARLRLLPPPTPEDSFSGEAARLTFEEDENSSGWIVAQTRLGEPSLTVIPLELQDEFALAQIGNERLTFDRNSLLPREAQLQLLRRSVRLSDRDVLPLLDVDPESLPVMFRESPLLRECRPLWLSNGVAQLTTAKKRLTLTLDRRLGLVIRKEPINAENKN